MYKQNNTVSLKNDTYYYGIDLFKFFCAFLVIAIHIHPFSSFSGLLDFGLSYFICLLAVPYFFISSGFLLARKINFDSFDKEVTLSYAFRIYKLYIIWSIIYFPINLFDVILKNDEGVVDGFISYFHDFVFLGSYSHLWYLNALFFSVLIITAFLSLKRKNTNKILFIISLFLYILGLLAQSYYVIIKELRTFHVVDRLAEVFKLTFTTTRNGLFFGLVFVVIGMIIFKNSELFSLKFGVVGFIISMILYAVEVLIVTKFNWAHFTEMYFFLLPAVSFLFLISIKIKLKNSKILKNLRYTGVLIYFIHLLVKRILIVFIDPVFKYSKLYSFILFLLVSIISFAISEIIVYISNFNRFKWLKILYN